MLSECSVALLQCYILRDWKVFISYCSPRVCMLVLMLHGLYHILTLPLLTTLRYDRPRREKSSDGVHTLPDSRVGERVSLQPIPYAATTDRDRTRALSHWAADQDLVPEPKNEVEERQQTEKHEPNYSRKRLPTVEMKPFWKTELINLLTMYPARFLGRK